MTHAEQLEKWVKGESIHNKEKDICCPDFSCCVSGILAPQKERDHFKTAFYKQDYGAMDELLLIFLGRMLEKNTIIITSKDIIEMEKNI